MPRCDGLLVVVASLLVLVNCGHGSQQSGRIERQGASIPATPAPAEGDEIHAVERVVLRSATLDVVERLARAAPSVRELELRESTLASLDALSDLHLLERLVVEGAHFEDLHALEKLPRLTHLELIHRGEAPPDLSALERLPRLESVSMVFMSDVPVEVVLRELPAMRRLRAIAVAGTCGPRDPDLTTLSLMPLLERVSLSLECSEVSLDGIQRGHVRELSLSHMGVASLKPLAEAPSLRTLSVTALRLVADRAVNVWTTAMRPAFPRFYISAHGDEEERADLSDLAHATGLRVLEIIHTSTFDLGFLRELPRLERLILNDVSVRDVSELRALHGLSTCQTHVRVAAHVSDTSEAGTARAERALRETEEILARRTCPSHCDRGCTITGPHLRLR